MGGPDHMEPKYRPKPPDEYQPIQLPRSKPGLGEWAAAVTIVLVGAAIIWFCLSLSGCSVGGPDTGYPIRPMQEDGAAVQWSPGCPGGQCHAPASRPASRPSGGPTL